MFYCAEAVLFSKSLTPSKHSGVISIFGKEFIKTGILPKKLHRNLIHAFEERLKSDYEAVFSPSSDECEELIIQAGAFINKIKEYLNIK